jgi:hypothetical protein
MKFDTRFAPEGLAVAEVRDFIKRQLKPYDHKRIHEITFSWAVGEAKDENAVSFDVISCIACPRCNDLESRNDPKRGRNIIACPVTHYCDPAIDMGPSGAEDEFPSPFPMTLPIPVDTKKADNKRGWDYIYEDVDLTDVTELSILAISSAIYLFLRETGQIKGKKNKAVARNFGLGWLREWRRQTGPNRRAAVAHTKALWEAT